jgi:hypothetical protein
MIDLGQERAKAFFGLAQPDTGGQCTVVEAGVRLHAVNSNSIREKPPDTYRMSPTVHLVRTHRLPRHHTWGDHTAWRDTALAGRLALMVA